MDADIMRYLKEMAGKAQAATSKPALMEVALRDQAAFFARENPFAVGDIVTPRKGTSIMDPGEAHIVITVRDLDAHDFAFDGQPCSANYGKRLDLRVLRWSDGRFVPFWVESAEFEPWVDPQAQVTIALGEVAA